MPITDPGIIKSAEGDTMHGHSSDAQSGTPEKLYKYRGASLQDIANLSNSKIWFSKPERFNDPFDCAYDIAMPALTRADCEAIMDGLSKGEYNAARLARFSDDDLQRHVKAGIATAAAGELKGCGGISCFSAIPDNLLMWGHYADSHRGFCLEYSTASDPLFQKAQKVCYSDTLPAFSIDGLKTGQFSEILKLLLTKAKCWEYEQEWRLLHQNGDWQYGVDRSCLTGIYFGAKMPVEQMSMIAFLLSTTDTYLYKMHVSKTLFKVVAEPITFTPIDYRKPP
jgi:hypothetical protein